LINLPLHLLGGCNKRKGRAFEKNNEAIDWVGLTLIGLFIDLQYFHKPFLRRPGL
jgi:hypothetical protein